MCLFASYVELHFFFGWGVIAMRSCAVRFCKESLKLMRCGWWVASDIRRPGSVGASPRSGQVGGGDSRGGLGVILTINVSVGVSRRSFVDSGANGRPEDVGMCQLFLVVLQHSPLEFLRHGSGSRREGTCSSEDVLERGNIDQEDPLRQEHERNCFERPLGLVDPVSAHWVVRVEQACFSSDQMDRNAQ